MFDPTPGAPDGEGVWRSGWLPKRRPPGTAACGSTPSQGWPRPRGCTERWGSSPFPRTVTTRFLVPSSWSWTSPSRGGRQRGPRRRPLTSLTVPIMRPESLAFLKSLLDTPGPSAFEAAPARLWRKEAERFADEVRGDVSGNSYATLNSPGRPRVMLAGHIDEIGGMVTHIDDDGYVSFDTIGGWGHQVVVGQRVRLLGRAGAVDGVVGKKAIHIMGKDDREKVSKVEDLWIDVGAVSREEAQRWLRIGDPGVLAGGVIEFPNGRLVSRSIDNRIGAYVVLEAVRLLAGEGTPPVAAGTAGAPPPGGGAGAGGGAPPSGGGAGARAAGCGGGPPAPPPT